MTASPYSPKERLLRGVQYEANTGCWLWENGQDKWGYGSISVEGETLRVHRVSYTFFNGPIPKGLSVCHKCDVRICANPDHLWLGTIYDNTADKVRKGRQRGGNWNMTHCMKGHEFTPENTIRSKSTGRRRCAICAGRPARQTDSGERG